MAVITMRQMLEAGVHFGHQTRRWNPKMKRFIFGERNGIYIIDLDQTLTRVETAYGFVRDLVAGGGTLLFVGTKKQAQDPVRSYAEKCNMPYVNERWLGGMLTNFDTMTKRISKMLDYERMKASGDFDAMPKKEALLLSRELEKLQRNLGGLRHLSARPDAIFVLDTKKEHIAVTEANKLKIPVVAVVDTNVDPEVIQFPMPGNDDAIRANTLFARVIAEAVGEGRYIANKRNSGAEPVVRSVEDEEAFASSQADARREAAAAQAARDARLATPAATAGGTDSSDSESSAKTTDLSSGPADSIPSPDPGPAPIVPPPDPGPDPSPDPEPAPIIPSPDPEPIVPAPDPDPDPIVPSPDPNPDPDPAPAPDPEPAPIVPQASSAPAADGDAGTTDKVGVSPSHASEPEDVNDAVSDIDSTSSDERATKPLTDAVEQDLPPDTRMTD